MEWLQLLAAVVTIIAGISTATWKMLKFLLKDTHQQLSDLQKGQSDLQKGQEEFRQEMRLIHAKWDATNKRVDELNKQLCNTIIEQNARMDGVYRLILDRTYGIK
jgi:peptidoglycan hydrolase CwlO-like protein